MEKDSRTNIKGNTVYHITIIISLANFLDPLESALQQEVEVLGHLLVGAMFKTTQNLA